MSVSLYSPGESHARTLIDGGHVDDSSPWSMSADDENALLGDPPDWTAYGRWHLGADEADPSDTKAHWKYPFGKDGKVYRSALRAIASRASQQGADAIAQAASALLKAIDAKNAQNLLALKPKAQRRGVAAVARRWYSMVVQASADGQPSQVADVYLYDDIGESFWTDNGTTAKAFVDELKALPATVSTIRLHINSPGGDVFDALAMANALRLHPATKEVLIEGLVASAATIVSSAGDVVRMADNALLMVHDPMTLAIGQAKDLRATADVLDQIKRAIIASYQWLSSKNADELGALMSAETWMTADEAIANGLATEKMSGLKATALLDPAAVARLQVPAQYRDQIAGFLKPAVASATEILAACRAADCLELAEALVAAPAPMADVQARIDEAAAAKAAARVRAESITALCATARQPELAAGYIDGGMTVDAVRAHLTTITAKLDRVEIDHSLRPDVSASMRRVVKAIDVTAVYAERNRLITQ